MRRLLLIALLAALVFPATASANWGPRKVAGASTGVMTCARAVPLTLYVGNALRYHGGVLRYNCPVYRDWCGSCGIGSPFQDIGVGVRWRDGRLGRGYVDAQYVGCCADIYNNVFQVNLTLTP